MKGFFATVLAVCQGTAIFPELIQRPLRRALWHLLLLAFLAAIVIVGCHYRTISDDLAVSAPILKRLSARSRAAACSISRRRWTLTRGAASRCRPPCRWQCTTCRMSKR